MMLMARTPAIMSPLSRLQRADHARDLDTTFKAPNKKKCRCECTILRGDLYMRYDVIHVALPGSACELANDARHIHPTILVSRWRPEPSLS